MKTKTVFYSFSFLCMASILFTFSCQKKVDYEPEPGFKLIPFSINFLEYCGTKPNTSLVNVTSDLSSKKTNQGAIKIEVNWKLKDGSWSTSKVNQYVIENNIFKLSVPIGKSYQVYTTYIAECKTCNGLFSWQYFRDNNDPAVYDATTTSITEKLFSGGVFDCSIAPASLTSL